MASLISFAGAAQKVVIIDAGHGGKDGGSKWGNATEKHLNLDVAKRVEAILKKKGIPVHMTRRTDKFVSLNSRAAIANRHSNSIFVSIHFNASLKTSAKGIETYYLSDKGKRLAYAIQRRLATRIRTDNRGVKQRHYAVLKNTRSTAALVECGFLSNPWERSRCLSTWYRAILAQEIASGIVSYYKHRK